MEPCPGCSGLSRSLGRNASPTVDSRHPVTHEQTSPNKFLLRLYLRPPIIPVLKKWTPPPKPLPHQGLLGKDWLLGVPPPLAEEPWPISPPFPKDSLCFPSCPGEWASGIYTSPLQRSAPPSPSPWFFHARSSVNRVLSPHLYTATLPNPTGLLKQ